MPRNMLTSRFHFHNNNLIFKQHHIMERFWGMDNVRETSKNNLRTLRKLLSQGDTAVRDKIITAPVSLPEVPLLIPSTLSPAEKQILNCLMSSFTLKHGTNALEIIKANGGKMQALRQREAEGQITANRHTAASKGLDESLYFVMGIGDHKIPEFVSSAQDVISVNLTKLAEEDSLTLNRFWVSGHIVDFDLERNYQSRLGNAKYVLLHNKNYQKTYEITYDNGTQLKWVIDYKDEIFSGADVAPGIALKFIYLLRLLGGNNNPLVHKLYSTNTPAQCQSLLEKIMPVLMPGDVYPEAKMIGELNVFAPYISFMPNVPKQKPRYFGVFALERAAIEDSIKTSNLVQLQTLIQKGYSLDRTYGNLLSTVLTYVNNAFIRHEMIKFLVTYGISTETNDRSSENPLYVAVKSATSADLDHLLSLRYPLFDEPLIEKIIDPNARFDSQSEYYDLIDLACASEDAEKKLQVLKKHGANFSREGLRYIRRTLNSENEYMPIVNVPALAFLIKEGVSLFGLETYNETPLMTVVKRNDLLLVQILVSRLHADINAQFQYARYSMIVGRTFFDDPSNGKTALHFAAERGYEDIFAYLISRGADIWLKTADGRTALDFIPAEKADLKARLKQAYYQRALPILESQKLRPLDYPVLREDKIIPLMKKPHHSSEMRHQKVAVMLTGVRADGKKFVVLGRPRSSEENQKNYFCFPGGSADPSDLNLQDAALRELFEETSIDVKKIPNAAVHLIGEFSDFNLPEHDTTTIFMVDVGLTPIKPYACDDLAELKCVLLESLVVNKALSGIESMVFSDKTVLGSNGLIINYILLQGHLPLPREEFESIKARLHIETKGYKLLVDAIKNRYAVSPEDAVSASSGAGYSRSLEWQTRIEYLLSHKVHLQKHLLDDDLVLTMLQVGTKEGLQLLIEHGVDLYGAGKDHLKRKYYATPLDYCVQNNDLNSFHFLIAKGADFQQSYAYTWLAYAAKNGSLEMFQALLKYGLKPQSEYLESSAGRVITQPILGMVIKHNQIDFLKQLLLENTVPIGRERSPIQNNTTLMTAIDYNQKEAALLLLATSRINLLHVNKQEQSLSTLLKKKEDWADVAEVVSFLIKYQNVNDFLRQHYALSVDDCQWKVDSDLNPTIHLMSNNLAVIQQLAHVAGRGCTIHQQENNYFIRFGHARLHKLGIPKDVVRFLLTYGQGSPVWMVNDAFAAKLLRDELTTFSSEGIAANISPVNRHYITQVTQECASLIQLELGRDSSKEDLDVFLALTLGQDKIQTVQISEHSLHQLKVNGLWQPFEQWINHFPKLNKIIYRSNKIDRPLLMSFLEMLSKRGADKWLTIEIDSQFKDLEISPVMSDLIHQTGFSHELIIPNAPVPEQQRINMLISSQQLKALLAKEPAFQQMMENRSINKFVDNQETETHIKYKLYYQWLASAPTEALSISGELNINALNGLEELLIRTRRVTSVEVSSLPSDDFAMVLRGLLLSKTPLQHLDLSCHEFKPLHVMLLTEVLKAHRIRFLDISFASFSIESASDRKVLDDLAQSIKLHLDLEILNADPLQSRENGAIEAFLDTIAESQQLLSLRLSSYNTSEGLLKKAYEMSIRNCINHSIRYSSAAIGFFQPIEALRDAPLLASNLSLTFGRNE